MGELIPFDRLGHRYERARLRRIAELLVELKRLQARLTAEKAALERDIIEQGSGESTCR